MHWRINSYEHALEDAKKSLSLNSDLFEARYLIGIILGRKTDPENPEFLDQALEALISASQINSTNSDLLMRISDLWQRKGESNKARLAMFRAVELSPESNFYLRRYTVLLEKDLDETVRQNSAEISESLHKTLKHMLKLFPNDSWVHAHYGNWAWTNQNYPLAEIHLQRSLEIQSVYPWASLRLGGVYFSQ